MMRVCRDQPGLCQQRALMTRKDPGPEAEAPGCRQGFTKLKMARGKLQGVRIDQNLNFISSPGPNLENLRYSVEIILSKDSQSSVNYCLCSFLSASCFPLLRCITGKQFVKNPSLLTIKSTASVGECLFLPSLITKKKKVAIYYYK